MIFLKFDQEIDDALWCRNALRASVPQCCWPQGLQKMLPTKIHPPSNQLTCILQPPLRAALALACQETREICSQTACRVLPLPASLSNTAFLLPTATDEETAANYHLAWLDMSCRVLSAHLPALFQRLLRTSHARDQTAADQAPPLCHDCPRLQS